MLVTPELIAICEEIVSQSRAVSEWSAIESCDMFQTEHFCGGFDADELAFCFSWFRGASECWFQITLEEAEGIANGTLRTVQIRPAEGPHS